MPNSFFRFKQFTIHQHRTAMKVTTDACLFGAWIANQLKKAEHPLATVLDIGAGTGLLSLMIAQQFPAAITAVEMEPDAALQCNENSVASPWPHAIEIIQEDIITAALRLPLFDCIISNPPFYENDLPSPRKEKNMAHHGQTLSLRDLLHVIHDKLDPQGKFYLLYAARREPDVTAMLREFNLQAEQQVRVHASAAHAASRVMISGMHKRHDHIKQQEDFFIREENGEYTNAFRLLLHDYYLDL